MRAVSDGPNQPGRHCPLSYRYSPRALARASDFVTDTFFVIGGLYGNVSALSAALQRIDAEPGARAIFNGDFHWFDVDPVDFDTFCGTQFGLMTRISARPAKDALYRAVIDGVYVEAIPIDFDPDTWLAHFSERWPQGSAAHTSYFERMKAGPGYLLSSAVREGFRTVTSQATIG